MKKRFLTISVIIVMLLTAFMPKNNPTINDALEILKQLAGLPNTASQDSTILDALEILKFLAGLESVYDIPVTTTPIASGTTGSSTPTEPPTTTTPPTLPATPLSDFEYTVRMGVAEIISYKGNSADVVVPAVIEGNPVAIRPNAFANAEGLKTVTFLEENPQVYIAHRPFQAAVQARPQQIIPGGFEDYIIGYVDRVTLPGAWINGIYRRPVYVREPVWGQRPRPDIIIPAVPAQDAIPAREASGISSAMFGNVESFTIYVPAGSITAYRNLLTGQTIRSATTGTGIFSISVKSPPNKIEYIEGQTLNTAGITIEIHSWNSTTETITSGFAVSETVLNEIGTNRIIVTYEGKQSWFDVEVLKNRAVELEVLTMPDKTVFFKETLDGLAGLSLKVTYLNGNTDVITDGFFVAWQNTSGSWRTSDEEFDRSGKITVRIGYGSVEDIPWADYREGKFTHTTFEILNDAYKSLEILTLPDKLEYFSNEAFDTTGLSMKLTYLSGKVETLTTDGYFMRLQTNAHDLWYDLNDEAIGYHGKITLAAIPGKTDDYTWLQLNRGEYVSATFEIEVAEFKIIEIKLLSELETRDIGMVPSQSFREFSVVDLEFEVSYSDGTKKTISRPHTNVEFIAPHWTFSARPLALEQELAWRYTERILGTEVRIDIVVLIIKAEIFSLW
jgi:hypothetical protein